MTTIHFLSVKTNQEKLSAVCRVVGQHFFKGERVLILVSAPAVADYIDQLLWSMPPESFVPHIKTEEPSSERVVITTSSKNLNQASILINLGTTIPAEIEKYELVYELYDTTHPTKAQLSQERYATYSKEGKWELKRIGELPNLRHPVA